MFITPVEAESYEILIDKKNRSERMLGLRVNPLFGDSFVIPMTATTASEIGKMLIAESQT
ncbi:hypothetical protein ACRU43_12880 [Mycobacterium colombiense]